MIETWADFRDDDSVDVAIVTGAGDAFCAGADLKTYIPPIIEDATPGRDPRRSSSSASTASPAACTASTSRSSRAVNGWALAGGLETALACDIRIASERAMFGSFEARRGYHHGDGGIVRLVNTCGVGVALADAAHRRADRRPAALAWNLVTQGRPARRADGRGRDGRRSRSCATPSARCARPRRRSST